MRIGDIECLHQLQTWSPRRGFVDPVSFQASPIGHDNERGRCHAITMRGRDFPAILVRLLGHLSRLFFFLLGGGSTALREIKAAFPERFLARLRLCPGINLSRQAPRSTPPAHHPRQNFSARPENRDSIAVSSRSCHSICSWPGRRNGIVS